MSRMLKRLLRTMRPGGSRRAAERPGEPVTARSLAAVRALRDLRALSRISRYASEPLVRETAWDRLRTLVVGGDRGLELNERVEVMRSLHDDALLAFAARRGREAELRLAAVQAVRGPRLLAEVVAEDADERVAGAALARLVDPEILGALERQLLHRDSDRAARVRRHRESVARAGGERARG